MGRADEHIYYFRTPSIQREFHDFVSCQNVLIRFKKKKYNKKNIYFLFLLVFPICHALSVWWFDFRVIKLSLKLSLGLSVWFDFGVINFLWSSVLVVVFVRVFPCVWTTHLVRLYPSLIESFLFVIIILKVFPQILFLFLFFFFVNFPLGKAFSWFVCCLWFFFL